MSSSDLYNYNGFKLISLELTGNPLIGRSRLSYNFIDPKAKQESIYTTVVIGPNGTGKSNLLRIIVELFKELYDLSQGRSRSYSVRGVFNLKYSLNGDIYEYTNAIANDGSFRYDGQPEINSLDDDKSDRAYLKINGSVKDFSSAQFPISIVANSIMLTDKFPFYRKEKGEIGERNEAFPNYKYLGVKNIPQSASTRAYVRRTVEFIVEQFEKREANNSVFLKALRRATDFLELDSSVDIYYYTSNTSRFFNGHLTTTTLSEYFESIHKRYAKPEDNPPYKLNQYLKIKHDEILLQAICDFCNQLVESNRLERLPYKNSSIKKIRYDLMDPELYEKLSSDYFLLEQLRQLGIVSSPEIDLKRTEGYSLQESSSGEYHFFSSIVGLIATVKPTNSLILIDEPEVSLHPNWQMKYLSFLRELFGHDEYSTCHIVVASHSHFLISDLEGGSSKIIGLKRSNGKISIVDLPYNTFGWSAEDVLYNIFNVRSSLNYYLEADLTELLGMISNNSTDKNLIGDILDKLKKLPVRKNDPLQEIIMEATDYYNRLE